MSVGAISYRGKFKTILGGANCGGKIYLSSYDGGRSPSFILNSTNPPNGPSQIFLREWLDFSHPSQWVGGRGGGSVYPFFCFFPSKLPWGQRIRRVLVPGRILLPTSLLTCAMPPLEEIFFFTDSETLLLLKQSLTKIYQYLRQHLGKTRVVLNNL